MSSFNTESGIPIAKIIGGKLDGDIIFVGDKNGGLLNIGLVSGKFQPIPNETARVIYVAGQSGYGKSTYCANYAKLFKKLYPDSTIILFSRIEDDPAFKGLEYNRVLLSDTLVENPIQLEEVMPNSLIIMDDIDTVSNTKLLRSLWNFEAQVLEMGRHKNIKIMITSHLIISNERKRAKTIFNELHTLTIFPQSGSFKQIADVLEHYFGMRRHEIDKILAIDSRWVTIYKGFPRILLSERNAMFLSQL